MDNSAFTADNPDKEQIDGEPPPTDSKDGGAPIPTEDKTAEKKEKVKLSQLFCFADKLDVLLMVVGTICATAAGTGIPLLAYYYADIATAFVYHGIYRKIYSMNVSMNYSFSDRTVSYQPDEVANIKDFVVDGYLMFYLLLGAGATALGTVQYLFWTIAGERQCRRIRTLYLDSLLGQDVSWYDVNNTRVIASKFSSDMTSISFGMSRGISQFFRYMCMWLFGLILAFVQSWKLTLACLSTLPLMIFLGVLNTGMLLKMTRKEKEEYAAAGAIAEETFSVIRTVAAFNGQEKERERYNKNLSNAEEVIRKSGSIEGFFMTFVNMINVFTGCIAIGYGTILYLDDGLEPGKLITVLVMVSLGGMGLIRVAACMKMLTEACEAAFRVYPMINKGRTLNAEVLKNFTFRIEPGQTVGLVGHTGSGKSTIAQLLERFYIPKEGSVMLDGTDTRHLDVEWLRRQIGFVGQEPVLFATTIAENIRYGNMDASQQDVIDAAVLANAHSFIEELPEKYETYVGDSGYQLSGGQKQRIAIARALVREPKILLLDEATSALDSAGEVIVQQAIDKVSEGRTTLIIAHRVSTVVSADKILVLNDGEIVEQGTHKELVEFGGCYKELVQNQIGSSIAQVKKGYHTDDKKNNGALTKKSKDWKATDRTDGAGEQNDEVSAEISSPIKRVLAFSRPELHLNIIGWIALFLFGTMTPILAIALTEMLRIFELPRDDVLQNIRILLGSVVGIGVGFFVIRQIGTLCLSKAASKLTTRIRDSLFATIVNQDMTFFDKPENRVGLLTNRLSTDSITIHGASALKLGSVLECIASFLTAVIIAMYYSWKLSLVVLAFVPVSVLSGWFNGKIGRDKAKVTGPVAKMGEVVQQVMNNVRLLRSLGCEKKFKETFISKAKAECSLVISICECQIYFLFVTVASYGAFLVQNEAVDVYVVFRVYMVLNHSASIMGGMMSYFEDFGRAKSAAARVFHTLAQVPSVNINASGKSKKELSGEMALDNVVFHYPSRPDVGVLRGLSLSLKVGEKVALVGVSGCGKSTISSLLERFYDPVSGTVLADGEDIRDFDLRWYRSQIGIVSQEPVLFDRTISENIQYGDNTREVTSPEVIEAARTANLHSFVASLPQGYDTVVGNKGTQLSGGQKQRVAIARALIRDPKLLILDEATSALDSHNEQIVQAALEKASEGRTTIVIAHRLSTVQRCDRIVLIHEGKIMESGTHADLMALEGIYYKLIQAQALAQTA